MEDQKKFLEVKNKAEKFYNEINSVYCPYFSEKVNFNAKGLDHIRSQFGRVISLAFRR